MKNCFRITGLIGATVLMGGCSLFGSTQPDDANTAYVQRLEAPPPLQLPKTNKTYEIPGAHAANATGQAVEIRESGHHTHSGSGGTATVVGGVKLMQSGPFHWLVVSRSPKAVWPVLVNYFQSHGFKIAQNDPHIGLLRTKWKDAEHGLPKGVFARLFSSLNDSGRREQYVVRVIPGQKAGTSEIFVSYQEAIEIRQRNEGLSWHWATPNPGKEATALIAMMQSLGATSHEVSAARKQTQSSHIVYTLHDQNGSVPAIVTDQSLKTVWPQVGTALNRVDLLVMATNPKLRVYQVKYSPSGFGHFFEGLLGHGTGVSSGSQYLVQLTQASNGKVYIRVLNLKGNFVPPSTATAVLKVLKKGLG